MSVLQWALLIVGVVAVLAIWWSSRREMRLPKDWNAPGKGGAARGAPKMPAADQMEMFTRDGEFDEFGVGKPRKRVMPQMPGSPPPPSEPPTTAPAPAPVADTAPPKPAKKKKTRGEEKIITLLIAEREGTAILGPKIHQALAAQGLVYGEKKIYHRMQGERSLFAVASLVKPGFLDPAEQQGFSTPGLSVFTLLPGPMDPALAVQDMIDTARALAAQLNAEVYDDRREPFTDQAARELLADVHAWVQRNPP